MKTCYTIEFLVRGAQGYSVEKFFTLPLPEGKAQWAITTVDENVQRFYKVFDDYTKEMGKY